MRNSRSRQHCPFRRAAAAGKAIAFALLAALMVYALDQTLTEKYVYGIDGSPTTSSFEWFYELEEDTLDVLLLGTSQIAAGLNPMDMYEEAGIRAYTIASGVQPIWLSYYWLKEVLQYQSPKVVVLECYALFMESEAGKEMYARSALDYMHAGAVKREAIQTVCSLDTSQGSMGYYLNLIRYHTRWSELDETDFTWMGADGIDTKGYWQYWDICGDTEFTPIESAEGAEPAEFGEMSEQYLDRMVALCEENDIELVLIKTPTYFETAERHTALQDYADANGLTFYDFNMKELYEEIGFDYAEDMSDSINYDAMNAHANPSGARKMSVYLADQLLGVNGLTSTEDDQWEATRAVNEQIREAFSLCHEEDLLTYLGMLKEERYTIFIAVRDEASTSLTDDVIQAMQDLGLAFEITSQNALSYVAVINGDEITEIVSEESIEIEGAVRGGFVSYRITSAGYSAGNTSSIEIDGTEYSVNSRGLNIVVYDNELKSVVDSVCFDTYSEEWTVSRS